MPLTRPLSNEEFSKIQSREFPTLTLSADQWGEHGYFYDPLQRHFAWYEIDRKEQTDSVTVLGPTAAVRAHCTPDQRDAVDAWLSSLSGT